MEVWVDELVFPAASSPSMSRRISLDPKILPIIFDICPPIFVEVVELARRGSGSAELRRDLSVKCSLPGDFLDEVNQARSEMVGSCVVGRELQAVLGGRKTGFYVVWYGGFENGGLRLGSEKDLSAIFAGCQIPRVVLRVSHVSFRFEASVWDEPPRPISDPSIVFQEPVLAPMTISTPVPSTNRDIFPGAHNYSFTTERLLFRPLRLDDTAIVFALKSDPQVYYWT